MESRIAAPGADPLLEWRAEFPILESTIYMVSHSLGAMPRGVGDEMIEYSRAWGSRGVRAWNEGWWDLPRQTGNLLAGILGAESDSIVMVPNVTTAEAIVLSALDYPAGRNGLVCTELDFPSVLYLYEGEKARGAEVKMARSADGISIPTENILALIDEHTRVVAISHVLFRSSYIVDIEPVIRRAREVGALVMLDAYQSVGTVPLDVRALNLDILVGGSVKWLCGGPGAGFLYVRPGLRETLFPRFVGWMGHARPFSFELEMDHAPNLYRFLNGTPHVPCLYAARPGYRMVDQIGVAAIREKSQRLTRRLMSWGEEFGIPMRTPADPARRGGTVSFAVPHPGPVAEELIRREIIVDWRPEAGVRIAPHFYTREDEVDETMRQLREIAAAVGA